MMVRYLGFVVKSRYLYVTYEKLLSAHREGHDNIQNLIKLITIWAINEACFLPAFTFRSWIPRIDGYHL